jgi:UDP-N-acetylmuramoyl-tripeptide--D-alanyl-D-alanine ligase
MMRPMSFAEIADVLDLPRPAQDVSFCGVSTDSRTIAAGELFVALHGERFDAHEFVGAAVARGAVAVVCTRHVATQVPTLLVPDTLLALGLIARHNRMLFAGRVVGLTGSAGKTTTKEMIAAILSRAGPTIATQGNLNNEVGVPLTLLRLDAQARFGVIEMGASKPGDIAYLGRFAVPDVALLTNAMPAHLQGFGSLEAIAGTKGEIYDALGPAGVAVLNIDDRFAPDWERRIGSRRLIRASARHDSAADVRAADVSIEAGMARFRLELPDGSRAVQLGVPGVHQVSNAVNAAAVALALGIGTDCIVSGLEAVRAVSGRMQQLRTDSGCLLIDDSYNANPGSVRAAIDSLACFSGERVLVLGNMAELGGHADALHREVGAYARERGIEQLLLVGEHGAEVARGYGARARVFASRDELAEACREFDRDGVVMLVKGSRSAGMEQVVEALTGVQSGLSRAGRH